MEYKNSNMPTWEKNKINYIESIYDSEDSKQIQYNLYKSNIKMYEDIKEKDIMYFNIDELTDLMKSIPSISYNIKTSVYSFILQYLDYQISRGNISINNMIGINKEKVTAIHQKSSRSRYISINRFYELISSFTKQSNYQELIPLVLSRYGISGIDMEDLINLKMSDLDKENNVANIYNTEGILLKTIPIDKNLIDWCVKAEDEKGYIGNNIVKNLERNADREITEAMIYNRVKKACLDNNHSRIKFSNLILSRKIDLALEIRKERKLTNGDFQSINLIFNPNASIGSYNSTVKFYESLTGDKVYKDKDKKELLIDNTAGKFVKEIKEELGIKESN